MQHTPTLEDVRGRWFIVQTSLNLWRKRQNPSITYTPLDAQRMHDDVQYTINNKTKHIIGIDTQNVADPCRFRWRGSAWYIRWVTSDWRIVEFNQAGGWCVVYFHARCLLVCKLSFWWFSPLIPNPSPSRGEGDLVIIKPKPPPLHDDGAGLGVRLKT